MTVDSVVTFNSGMGALDLAEPMRAAMTQAGIRATGTTQIGNGASFGAKVRRRSILVLLAPLSEEGDRWMIEVGPGIGPTGRLIGMKDDNDRTQVTRVIDACLAELGADEVQWFSERAWQELRHG